MKNILSKAGLLSGCVLALGLVLLAADGHAVPEWGMWYLAALGVVTLGGLWAGLSEWA